MQLCFICKQRFRLPFQEGCCSICRDNNKVFAYNIKNSIINKPEGARTFYIKGINTKRLTECMLNEEVFFNFSIGQSIKSWMNAYALQKIKEKTGLEPKTRNPDVYYLISFPDGLVGFEYGDVFIYGKYNKLKSGISQKRWKKYEKSVESIIGEIALNYFQAGAYYLHCSGREDVDVMNFGYRPFVIELKSAKKRWLDLKALEEKINKSEEVKVIINGYVRDNFVKLVSNSHFDKVYKAYIYPALTEEEKEKLKNIKDLVINQKTPKRVLSRRADKLRKRKIYSIDFDEDNAMIIKAEAGTYIKEFISGDDGRTSPSISSIIGKQAYCKQLLVNEIKSDFLDFVFEKSNKYNYLAM
ncbi:MAG: tRNA pseudouridine(54/55) synthase Pus10 [Candidatus Anstonellales archaeon]